MRVVSTNKMNRANETNKTNTPNKGHQLCRKAAAVLATAVAVACFSVRLAPQISTQGETTALTAAGFIMPRGAAQVIKTGFEENDTENSGQSILGGSSSIGGVSGSSGTSSQLSQNSTSSGSNSQSGSSATAQSGLGTAYPITELQMANAGVQYQNIFVKNSNKNHDIDIESELKKKPAVTIKTDGTPQVLIYHTHTTESYMSKNLPFYYSSFPTRTLDNSQNVVMVGNAIEAQLKAAGIGVIHDTTCHDYPSYNGSYYRSEATMRKDLKKYPGIQITLDIHRDAMSTADGGRLKPTATVNGKKAAQMMILAGCDDNGKLDFPNWEYNLRLALRLQKSTSDLYPGLARPLNFCNDQYNENITKGSLLIEIGTEVNTVEEATYTGSLFGKSMVKALLELK